MKYETSLQIARAKFPSVSDMSAAAWLLTIERIELDRLKRQKFLSIRAIDLLEQSVKGHADSIIQRVVPA